MSGTRLESSLYSRGRQGKAALRTPLFICQARRHPELIVWDAFRRPILLRVPPCLYSGVVS